MNAAAVSAWAQQNKKTLLIGGGVLAGGLGLMKARSGGLPGAGGSPSGSSTGGAVSAGRFGASGATLAGTVPAYDSSASDIVNAIRSMQEAQEQQRTPTPVTAPPLASKLFAPAGTKQIVRYDDSAWELQSDGSLFGITGDQWRQQEAAGAVTTVLSGKAPTNPDGSIYSSVANIAARAAQTAAQQQG